MTPTLNDYAAAIEQGAKIHGDGETPICRMCGRWLKQSSTLCCPCAQAAVALIPAAVKRVKELEAEVERLKKELVYAQKEWKKWRGSYLVKEEDLGCARKIIDSQEARCRVMARTTDLSREDLAAAKAEIERLQGIVAKVPKTKDGVVVYPGMTIFVMTECDADAQEDIVAEPYADFLSYYRISECYSSRQAAEAGKQEKAKWNTRQKPAHRCRHCCRTTQEIGHERHPH